MKRIITFLQSVAEGLQQLVFPNICLCCGQEVVRRERHVCTFCLFERFEDANPENEVSAAGVLLPDGVVCQHALWTFDKGGMLQDLMHYLKYERLTAVGSQLGQVLARRVREHPEIGTRLVRDNPILVPVPLHYLKFRKRGFNQSFYIARGISRVLELPVCAIDAVVRRKYTLSQTGFTLSRRIKNMEDAFRVRRPEAFAGRGVIIVDDVFTTGATSFELARTLLDGGASYVMIWTLAQA